MTKDDNFWNDAVKGVKKIKTNRFVREIKPKEVVIRKDRVTTVTFDALRKGKSVAKDDFSHMDGSLARRFRREEFKVSATLDLHGVTEKEAFNQVCEFIKQAYERKKRCILIITGKGLDVDSEVFSSRGVLKKSVPMWLENSEISSLILAYKNPSEAMGGSGALYILLRKKS